MRVSEYIKKLEALKEKHGDLEVTTYRSLGGVGEANEPEVREIRKKRRNEYKRYYLNSWGEGVAEKTVIHV